MYKLKLFLENFLVYGLGGIISKIIPLIMVPIVTRIMPDSSYYGISDLSNTVVQFGSAIAIMGMYDAMYRMFFEEDDEKYKKRVCSTALAFTMMTSVVIFLLMIALKDVISQYFFSDRQYAYVVYLSAMATLVGATNSVISAPTRMQNKRKIFLVTNTVGPLVSYGVAIPLLLSGYYTVALPLAGIISGITMEATFGILNHQWFNLRNFDFTILKKLIAIGIPLLPNFLIYWVFNSSDKVMITNLIGVDAAGIYSVGAKLGHVSQLIYTAFAGGWQYFAFSTMKDKNQIESNSKVYEYLGIISFSAGALVCAVSYLLYKVLFTEEYLAGYIVAPYLFLAPLLQMLYQVGNNQFLVIKKTWPGMFILSSGAIVNIILNLILIPQMGIEGAAVATLTGYIIVDIVDIIVLRKCGLMKPSIKFLYAAMVETFYVVLWRIFFSDKPIIGMTGCVSVWVVMAVIYRKDLMNFLTTVKSAVKARRKNNDL